MGSLEEALASALDARVPPRPHPERWASIARDAGLARRRRLVVAAAPAAAVAAVVAVLALAWPFSSGPTGTIIERAAAAIGDGPVLHVVIRAGWGGTLVDLRSGARSDVHGEDELWYDPRRGVHDISRFQGVMQFESVYPPGRVQYLDKTLAGLATGYRQALHDGTARVLGPGTVDGKAVYWIRVDTQLLPDAADGRHHEWAHDVAVAQSDYEPVATRETRDGTVGPDGESTIVSVETLPAGAGDFARTTPDQNGTAMSSSRVGSLTPAEANSRLGGKAVWAGRSIDGLDLTRIWADVRREGYDRASGTWQKTFTGTTFWYGEPAETGAPFPGGAVSTPFVQVAESLTVDDGFQRGVRGYSPPEGSVLVVGGRIGLMQIGGVHIALEATNEELLLAAARALTPVQP